MWTPQVKICGLTRVDEALACAEMGAQAIGCVFYPPSPRHVSEEQARDICVHLPPGVMGIGVFVNEDYSTVMRKAERCVLRGVQLHGSESSELVGQLLDAGLMVIKALFAEGTPGFEAAESFGASAYLVECPGGPLPGGNALAWNWEAAFPLARRQPTILAGGLNPENVIDALRLASPDAVDVSSGVEKGPGRKDLNRVKRFLEAVARWETASRKPRRIFR